MSPIDQRDPVVTSPEILHRSGESDLVENLRQRTARPERLERERG